MSIENNLHEINYYHEYTRSYDTRYVAEISHTGLESYRVLKDMDEFILDNKVDAQFVKWDEQWKVKTTKKRALDEKIQNLDIAETRTSEARSIQNDIENILIHTLSIDDSINWDSLISNKKFPVTNPSQKAQNELRKIKPAEPPVLKEIPLSPLYADYEPESSLGSMWFGSIRRKKEAKAKNKFKIAMDKWEGEKKEIENSNRQLRSRYESDLKDIESLRNEIKEKYRLEEVEWERQKAVFLQKQSDYNLKVKERKELYHSGDANSIQEYCEMVLNNSQYPDCIPKDFQLDYSQENKNLIVEYVLPSPSDIPTLIEVKYIASKKELKEYHLPESKMSKLYDDLIYKITLRTIHELFEADQIDAIDFIVFNGWVNEVNKANGKMVNNCIVSIHAKKAEFLEIELQNIDPKTCFKSLKGVGSSKLSGITAIQPILEIKRTDKRFVASQNIEVDNSVNLAIMNWEDFEHLIRELFEKEFQSNGGEVKVTQASRDGGVDAIAFDPDPIRGGKIVIQAKRYSNTVGVSAVRDLYGTVLNEGANKGILVTTSDYGSDSYEFAKGKPLTLLNGSHLLYLLEKHGTHARIDLKEAKEILRANN